MKPEELRTKLITAGVRSAHEFGYAYVTAENILTDEVYKMYFASMLRQSRGPAGPIIDKAIDNLLAEIGEKS